MDFDISDILADVHSSSSTLSPDNDLASTAALDHQQLTRLWISERTCPDLLPWPTALMHRVTSRVRAQISRIEDLAAGIVPTSGAGLGNQNLNLILSILQSDLSRTQFLIRSLLRQRLAKLTKHAGYYLTLLDRDDGKDTKEENGQEQQLLAPAEQEFLKRHQALLAGLYGASFLEAFPVQLRRLDDTAGGVNMVEGPEGKGCVFVRCLRERWGRSGGQDGDEDGGGAGVEMKMRRGEVWVVRWEDVKMGVLDGSLELL